MNTGQGLEQLKQRVLDWNQIRHETKRNVLLRFLAVVLVVGFYFTIVSLNYGIREGILITLVSWSSFVFCTPLADAGFLLDFPIRLITGMRMIYSEILVWIFAGSVNIFTWNFRPGVYQKFIPGIFKHILLNPVPYWLIIFISAAGTFLSVYFGDELMDVMRHKDRIKYLKHQAKHRFIWLGFVLALLISSYTMVVSKLGIEIF